MILTYDYIMKPQPSNNLLYSFTQLKDDNYLKHKYPFRKRSFIKGDLNEDFSVKTVEDTKFWQEKRINKYVGGIERIYPRAGGECVEYFDELMSINKETIRNIVANRRVKVGIHQIRITCQNDNEGFPVPEGFHQDGVDYVIIAGIQSNNISGGLNYIRYGSQDGPDILDRMPNKNEALLLNDKRVYHYASPIFAKYENVEGTRDSIIITLSLTN